MQSMIWSQDRECFIWSDEITQLVIFAVPNLQSWFVRAYRNESDYVLLDQFKSKVEAQEFVLRTIIEIDQLIPIYHG